MKQGAGTWDMVIYGPQGYYIGSFSFQFSKVGEILALSQIEHYKIGDFTLNPIFDSDRSLLVEDKWPKAIRIALIHLTDKSSD